MEVIYGLIPSMIVIGLVMIGILFWSIKSGQFDDFEGEAHRILMDEDLTPVDKETVEEASSTEEKKADNESDKKKPEQKTDPEP